VPRHRRQVALRGWQRGCSTRRGCRFGGSLEHVYQYHRAAGEPNNARFPPPMIFPSWSMRSRSETVMSANGTPKGFTLQDSSVVASRVVSRTHTYQKWSGLPGSRTVMCPATPVSSQTMNSRSISLKTQINHPRRNRTLQKSWTSIGKENRD